MRIRRPSYGRVLAQFREGAVFAHPRGLTLSAAFAQEFACTFHEANPIYLNREYARAHGYDHLVVSPLLVLNLALSMGVQNDSEQAIAHLGYRRVVPLRPVYPEETLRSFTRVLGVRERGAGKPGVVRLQTVCVNQDDEPVLRYERAVLIPARAPAPDTMVGEAQVPFFEAAAAADAQLPVPRQSYPGGLTGSRTYAEDFTPGEVIVHAAGRTVTDEHLPWTYRLLNTHPLHFDRIYTAGLEGALSGEPVVYGGLVFAWICGLASRDVSENALWDLEYDEGYHTQPVFAGDTLTALSRIEAVEDWPGPHRAAVVRVRHVGLKNVRPEEALAQHGEELFRPESEKKALGKRRLEAKVFEIERRLLIKRRPV
ncbi:MAG: acyl dehydratase [Planctomycetota bacterium]|nr:MAG: acyl dehydratase [Planctomycetota bacterium]